MTTRWIVTDLDGTLLDETERCPLSPRFLAEVSATHRVVLASSRTVEEIRDVAAALGWPAVPCIAEDGQVVVDASGRVEVLGMTTATLLSAAILFALACVVIAMILCALRLMIGPSAQDRVLALDTLWMCTMLLMLMLGIRHGSQIYFEAALIIALLGFVSTIALAKFLMRGEVSE